NPLFENSTMTDRLKTYPTTARIDEITCAPGQKAAENDTDGRNRSKQRQRRMVVLCLCFLRCLLFIRPYRKPKTRGLRTYGRNCVNLTCCRSCGPVCRELPENRSLTVAARWRFAFIDRLETCLTD